MLELPEITTIARQLNETVRSKGIRRTVLLSSPHKFAFLNRTQEEYPRLLAGCHIHSAESRGNYLLLRLDASPMLVLGDMGGRLLFHAPGDPQPVKHQLMLEFEDESSLTLTLQMWGAILLLDDHQISRHSRISYMTPGPLDEAFTFEHFEALIRAAPDKERSSLKYFIISQFGLPGVGNGCTHDILFNARLHPKFPLTKLTEAQTADLYRAARDTLQQMTSAGGRATERDLFDRPGGYQPILSNEVVGKPCPVCGTPIERITYLGGASFFCPHDQVL
ncbi:MAG: DNA-formamidopyrimidine glycosylase family protein [Anaerolineaceae bacterium]